MVMAVMVRDHDQEQGRRRTTAPIAADAPQAPSKTITTEKRTRQTNTAEARNAANLANTTTTMAKHDRTPNTKKKQKKKSHLLVVLPKTVIPDTVAVASTNPLTTTKTDRAVVTAKSTAAEGEDIALAPDLLVMTQKMMMKVADPVPVVTASATTIFAVMVIDQETETTNRDMTMTKIKCEKETEKENASANVITIAKVPAGIVTVTALLIAINIALLAKRIRTLTICHHHRLRPPRLPPQIQLRPQRHYHHQPHHEVHLPQPQLSANSRSTVARA